MILIIFEFFLRKGGEGERGWGSVPADSLLDKRMGAIDRLRVGWG